MKTLKIPPKYKQKMEISHWMRLLLALCIVAVTTGVHTQAVHAADRPGWRVTCNYSHSLKDDPIVFPNQPGASHLHDFIGAISTAAGSTFDSLRIGGTACALPGDTAAYWVPALYQNGQRLLPTAMKKNALIYYRRVAVPTGTVVQPYPPGLKMLIGNGHAMSAQENPGLGTTIGYACATATRPPLAVPPTQCASGMLVISFVFPNCWDGINVDSPDHISHMSYPVKGKCPASHPVNVPRLEVFFRYPVGTAPIGTITLDSGPYYTVHMDFFNAWDPSALQSLITTCINAGIDCGTNPSVGA
jgi:uncharacterized protein DUF1996